ncbi:MAG TPA: GNAT family N-acyltransferase [Pseudolabrys sp.]|jgi:putative hemolysin|nr:GNAT family N-acyltransferase [Pseudolabrys sp.]
MRSRATIQMPRSLFERFRPAPSAPGVSSLFSSLQAYGGLQAWATRAHRPSQSLGHIGTLEVRLAQTAAEVRQAQKLRYRVFYQEGSAIPNPGRLFARRDVDAYDAICDHLLVVDHAASDRGGDRSSVVGTYRLLRQPLAEEFGGFYTGGEFDIGTLIARHSNLQFLELGRSCVLAPYRNKRTVELLWYGIHAYILQNHCDVMFGCASLDGTDPERLALPLSFLHHYAAAPEPWHARARHERYVRMNRVSKESIDPKEALRALPPLIKGYLRLGAYIGDGAVIDYEFGTTDVLIVLPVSAIKQRYLEHFDLSRLAA